LRSLVEKIELAKELGNEIPMGEAIKQKEESDELSRSVSKKCNQLLKELGFTMEEEKVLKIIKAVEKLKRSLESILNFKPVIELTNWLRKYTLPFRT